MKYVALAMLLAVMQASPPVPRKTPDAGSSGSHNIKQNADSHKAPPTAPVVQPSSPPPDTNDRQSVTKNDTQKPIRIGELPPVSVKSGWRDTLSLIFAGLLVAIGTYGVLMAKSTLKAIERQAKANEDQLTEIQQSAEKTDRMILIAAQEAEHGRVASEAAKKSADAAKTSADIAASVSVPTLAIEKFENGLTGVANLSAFLQCPKIDIVIKNYGQTPAFLKWWTIIFTCEDLPDIPVYQGYAGCGMILEKVVVEPHKPYRLPELGFPHRQEIALADVQSIIDRSKILNAYGYICYGDLFGNPLRRLKFCETALNLSGNEEGPFWIQWVSSLAPARYEGTEQFPFPKPSSGKSQPARTDAKA